MSISGSHKFAIAKSNKRKKQNSVIMPRGLPENKMACQSEHTYFYQSSESCKYKCIRNEYESFGLIIPYSVKTDGARDVADIAMSNFKRVHGYKHSSYADKYRRH